MRTTWRVIFAASATMATIDVLHAQSEENLGKNEFLQSCASCHGASGKGDGPVANSLSPRPADLTKLSEANNGVFPVLRVHEVIDGRIERLVHGSREMPVWGERYMREMISPESPNFVSKEWAEARCDGVSRLWSNIFQHCSDERAGVAELLTQVRGCSRVGSWPCGALSQLADHNQQRSLASFA
jgi:mono/diheme cytochrome c family protein